MNTLFSFLRHRYPFDWGQRSSSIEEFLTLNPFKKWDDYWFLLNLPGIDVDLMNKKEWDSEIQFPSSNYDERLDTKTPQRRTLINILKMYRKERAKRFKKKALSSGYWFLNDEGALEPTIKKVPKFDDVFEKGCFETTIRLIDKEIIENGPISSKRSGASAFLQRSHDNRIARLNVSVR